ncbi:asparaginase [Micromonospora sp. NPDC049523]|uniref:asparaginase n=1 Tax=Micromonospora sp. NPDC049523 TaxID=3155921 RepID=UPI0034491D3B
MTRLLLVTTGDMMAFHPRPGRGAFASGTELLAALPSGSVPAEVTVEDLLAVPSWDLDPETMLRLARRARTAVLDDGYDGVVITHGTDTLEETAYLTDLLSDAAAERAGIVFTGAMRPPTELSADGPRNLRSALVAAGDPALRGVGVVACLNDELHAARWVSKIDATGVAAFSSAPYPVLGRVVGTGVELLAAPPPRPPAPTGEPESAVALIKTYPGIDGVLLHAVVDAGARGVVLEGTGLANVPISLLTAIDELTGWDIPVVISSRSRFREVPPEQSYGGGTLAGRVGAISARGLAPVKARAALMVALGDGGVRTARDWFGRLDGGV